MRRDTVDALEAMFRKAPVLQAGPVPPSEIESAFAGLKFAVPKDYRSFLEAHGGAIVGAYRVYGLRKAAAMGVNESSALRVTERFRQQRWPGVEEWLIISMDHSGNPLGLDVDGKVWISDHDAGRVSVVASSFEEFLRRWCLGLSA